MSLNWVDGVEKGGKAGVKKNNHEKVLCTQHFRYTVGDEQLSNKQV